MESPSSTENVSNQVADMDLMKNVELRVEKVVEFSSEYNHCVQCSSCSLNSQSRLKEVGRLTFRELGQSRKGMEMRQRKATT
jgi:hypothetical protein